MPASTALYRRKQQLQSVLGELPPRPGVYRFYDAAGVLIYVGKSVCLRDRVRSYFAGRARGKKERRLRQEISRLEWQETGSELEALLLESRLVKRHQPRFNVMLRAFVPLPYVRVDLRDPFPMLEITREPARDGADYFGPFPRQEVLEAAVGALAGALGLRDCPVPGERITAQRPCHRRDLGLCAAPCAGAVGPAEYREAVDRACEALEGRSEAVLGILRARMERAAERLQFEAAARFRDAARHIEAVAGRQHALASAVQELSLVAACPSRARDSLCLFVFRSGRLVRQEEVPRAELLCVVSRRRCAERLTAARLEPDEQSAGLDAALLDEVQIVTGWMKRNTGEGACWRFPPSGNGERALAAWLGRLVAPGSAVPAARQAA